MSVNNIRYYCSGNRSINKCLQVEVNDLVNGLRQLDEISKSMSKI